MVCIPFGKCCVPDRLAGGARLLTRWMRGGTQALTERELNYRIGRMSGDVESLSDYDKTIFFANVKSDKSAEALEVVLNMVYRPRLEDDIFHRTKKFMLNNLAVERKFPAAVFRRQVFESLFPDHAFGRAGSGATTSLELCMPMAFRCLHGLYFSPSKTVLVVAGPLEPAQIMQALNTVPSWMQSANVNLLRKPLPRLATRDIRVKSPSGSQGFVFVGTVFDSSVTLRNRLRLQVLGELLTGLNGRLTVKLRKEKGLTYAPETLREFASVGGLWGIMTMTPAGRELETRDLIRAEHGLLAKTPPTIGELETAKDAVATLLAKVYERNSLLAVSIADRIAYDLPLTDYRREKSMLESISPSELSAFVARLFKPERAVSVTTR